MNDQSSRFEPGDADRRRFELEVWPQTPARPWHAEVSVGGEFRRCFEQPIDLVLYLTQLCGSTPPPHPRGLR